MATITRISLSSVVVAGVVLAIVWQWDSIGPTLQRVDPLMMTWLLILQLATIVASAVIWFALLRKLGDPHALARIILIYFAGQFVEAVTPAAKLGGEAARYMLLRARSPLSDGQIAASIMVSKYFSLLPFVVLNALVLVYALWYGSLEPIWLFAFALLVVGLSVVIVGIHWPSTQPASDAAVRRSAWHRLLASLRDAALNSRALLRGSLRHWLMGLATLIWLLYPVKIYLVARMLDLPVDWLTTVVITYATYLISMVPLTPGGVGTFEGSMTLLWTLFGLEPASGLALALLARTITYWMPLLISGLATVVLLQSGWPVWRQRVG